MKLRKWICVLAALLLIPAAGGGEEAAGIQVTEQGLELADSRVAYPVVSGLEETLNETVNRAILTDCDISGYLARMSQLLSGGSLQVKWTGGTVGDVFSCAVRADGAITDSRPDSRWTWTNLDLRSGERISAGELFAGGAVPTEALETILEQEVAPELSAHLLNSEITPLPEGFWLNETGITFLYPVKQLSTLSDRAGAVHLSWNEIRDLLDLEEGSLADRLGVSRMLTLNGAEAIRAMAESGRLPGIPVVIGEELKPLTDGEGMLTDPDVWNDGESQRMFALEGAAFRDICLLTDFLSEDWEESRVQGIRADRGCYYGLCVGETNRQSWQQELGEPDATIAVDGERTEQLRMTEIMESLPGTCDYYQFGDYRLRLYSDAEGTLVSLMLTE